MLQSIKDKSSWGTSQKTNFLPSSVKWFVLGTLLTFCPSFPFQCYSSCVHVTALPKPVSILIGGWRAAIWHKKVSLLSREVQILAQKRPILKNVSTLQFVPDYCNKRPFGHIFIHKKIYYSFIFRALFFSKNNYYYDSRPPGKIPTI